MAEDGEPSRKSRLDISNIAVFEKLVRRSVRDKVDELWQYESGQVNGESSSLTQELTTGQIEEQTNCEQTQQKETETAFKKSKHKKKKKDKKKHIENEENGEANIFDIMEVEQHNDIKSQHSTSPKSSLDEVLKDPQIESRPPPKSVICASFDEFEEDATEFVLKKTPVSKHKSVPKQIKHKIKAFQIKAPIAKSPGRLSPELRNDPSIRKNVRKEMQRKTKPQEVNLTRTVIQKEKEHADSPEQSIDLESALDSLNAAVGQWNRNISIPFHQIINKPKKKSRLVVEKEKVPSPAAQIQPEEDMEIDDGEIGENESSLNQSLPFVYEAINEEDIEELKKNTHKHRKHKPIEGAGELDEESETEIDLQRKKQELLNQLSKLSKHKKKHPKQRIVDDDPNSEFRPYKQYPEPIDNQTPIKSKVAAPGYEYGSAKDHKRTPVNSQETHIQSQSTPILRTFPQSQLHSTPLSQHSPQLLNKTQYYTPSEHTPVRPNNYPPPPPDPTMTPRSGYMSQPAPGPSPMMYDMSRPPPMPPQGPPFPPRPPPGYLGAPPPPLPPGPPPGPAMFSGPPPNVSQHPPFVSSQGPQHGYAAYDSQSYNNHDNQYQSHDHNRDTSQDNYRRGSQFGYDRPPPSYADSAPPNEYETRSGRDRYDINNHDSEFDSSTNYRDSGKYRDSSEARNYGNSNSNYEGAGSRNYGKYGAQEDREPRKPIRKRIQAPSPDTLPAAFSGKAVLPKDFKRKSRKDEEDGNDSDASRCSGGNPATLKRRAKQKLAKEAIADQKRNRHLASTDVDLRAKPDPFASTFLNKNSVLAGGRRSNEFDLRRKLKVGKGASKQGMNIMDVEDGRHRSRKRCRSSSSGSSRDSSTDSSGSFVETPLRPPPGFHGEKFYPFFTKKFVFSNHYQCENLRIEGNQFTCTEQYYMYMKAVVFHDPNSAEDILSADDPKFMKQLGSRVRGFQQAIWDSKSVAVMKKANWAKYSQNRVLRHALFETMGHTLVEANPGDKRWGVALSMKDDRIYDRSQWRGQNCLGEILTAIRERMFGMEKYKDETRDLQNRLRRRTL